MIKGNKSAPGRPITTHAISRRITLKVYVDELLLPPLEESIRFNLYCLGENLQAGDFGSLASFAAWKKSEPEIFEVSFYVADILLFD